MVALFVMEFWLFVTLHVTLRVYDILNMLLCFGQFFWINVATAKELASYDSRPYHYKEGKCFMCESISSTDFDDLKNSHFHCSETYFWVLV